MLHYGILRIIRKDNNLKAIHNTNIWWYFGYFIANYP